LAQADKWIPACAGMTIERIDDDKRKDKMPTEKLIAVPSSKSNVERLHTNQRMSQIVVHNGTVYIAGQVPKESKGKSIAEQATEVLNAIDKYLAEAGSDKSHILSASVWLSDMKYFEEFNKVWDFWVPQGNAPARACVEAKLVLPEYHVEVAVVAATKE
jgi:enamine deaminase RidA (YjgF/YER057c/UK114 family)